VSCLKSSCPVCCLPVGMCACLSVRLCLSACLSGCTCLSFYPSVCLSVVSSVCVILSVCLPACLATVNLLFLHICTDCCACIQVDDPLREVFWSLGCLFGDCEHLHGLAPGILPCNADQLLLQQHALQINDPTCDTAGTVLHLAACVLHLAACSLACMLGPGPVGCV